MRSNRILVETLLLAAILCVGGWLRLHDLGHNPPGVFRDEAEKALNAWSLARTGQAFEFVPNAGGQPQVRWNRWPLFIDVYGVKTSAIYQWALAPLATGDAPPGPARTRLPAAMAGLLSILALYGVLRRLWGPWVALGAAMWLAISPWSIAFSRWALQGAFIPLFMALGKGGLLLGRRRHAAWWLLGAFGLGMAFYAYSGARPFVLAISAVAVGLQWRAFTERRSRWWAIGAVVLFLALILPAAVMMLSGGASRFARISVFGEGRPLAEALRLMTRGWALHFSPSFLLSHGDPQPRHGVGTFGVLHQVEAVFVLIGLVAVVRRESWARWMILAWIVLFPIGAMLTNPDEMPHALRSIVALPLPQILAGYGLAAAFAFLRKRRAQLAPWVMPAAAIVVAMTVAVSVWSFSRRLFDEYPYESYMAWEAGFGEALIAARDAAGGEPVYVSGNIALAPYLILYYDATPPETLKQRGWAALDARLLPPAGLDMRRQWDALPQGAVLMALPYDRIGPEAIPTRIIHPPAPTRAASEQLAPLYVVYRKLP